MRRQPGFLILLMAGACAPPAVVYRPAADAVATETGPLAVELRNGERLVVRDARVERDTLLATRRDAPADSARDVRLPMDAVARITRDERGLSTLGSGAVGLVSGALIGFLALLGLVIAASR